MHVAEVKTSSTANKSVQTKRQPFFSKNGQDGFFSKSAENTSSFFGTNPIQTKLSIGRPNDKYEVEADAMADKVVRRLNTSENNNLSQSHVGSQGAIQSKCAECEKEDKLQKMEEPLASEITSIRRKPIFESDGELPGGDVQTKSLGMPAVQTKCTSCEDEEKLQKKEEEAIGEERKIQQKSNLGSNPLPPDKGNIQTKLQAGPTYTSDLENRLSSSKGGGSALNPELQNSMGSAFGADFSGVRIHTGSNAVQMNKELNAQAFAHGSDIYFNQGKYNINSTSGKHLLAHELTHTVQQGGAGKSQPVQTRIQRLPDWVSDAAGWVGDTASDAANSVVEGAEWVGGEVADGAQWIGGKVASGAGWVGDQISAAAQWVIDGIRGAIDTGKTYLNEKWENIQAFGRTCFEDINNGFGNLTHYITTPLAGFMSALSAMNADLLEGVWNMAKTGANALWLGINSVINGLMQIGEGMWDTVSGFINDIFNTVDNLFDNVAFDLLPDWIKDEARSLLNGLRSIWNKVSNFWTDLWQRLTSHIQEILTAVRSFVDNVILHDIEKVITMVRNLKEVYDYIRKIFADPEAFIKPYLVQLAGKLNAEAPPKAKETGNQIARENYHGDSNQTINYGSIQKSGDGIQRETGTFDEVIKGIAFYIFRAWNQLDILKMLWDTVVNTFWPPATLKAIYNEFSQLWNNSWVQTVESLYVPENFLEHPLVCLHDIWSNFLILLEFPLGLWRALNHVVGLLMGYITIIVVLVEAILGGIAAAEVGVLPGILAGAAAGLATMAPIGEMLMASYLIAEGATVVVDIIRVFTARQTCEKRQQDIRSSVSSFIGMAVALILQVLMALLADLVSTIVQAVRGIGKGVPKAPPVETPSPRPGPEPAPVPAPEPAPVPAPIHEPAPPPAPIPFPRPRPAPAPAELPLAAKFEEGKGLKVVNQFSNEFVEQSEINTLKNANTETSPPAIQTAPIVFAAAPIAVNAGATASASVGEIDPDACKDEKCPAPNVSAPGIGNEAIHGAQPSRNRTGPRIHHTQSEHIIPFATARSLRLAVGLTERARRVLARFDNGMITIIIYRGAAEGKNTQDNVYSARFEADMQRAEIPRKTEQAKQRYEAGDIAGGEALAREVVSSVTGALDALRESAVERTAHEIQVEWLSVEQGCTKTNGQRRGESGPIPEGSAVAGAADRQLDGIIDLVAEALLQQ